MSETALGARIRFNPRTALKLIEKPGAYFRKQGLVFVSHILSQPTGFLVALIKRTRTFRSKAEEPVHCPCLELGLLDRVQDVRPFDKNQPFPQLSEPVICQSFHEGSARNPIRIVEGAQQGCICIAEKLFMDPLLNVNPLWAIAETRAKARQARARKS